MCGVADDVDTIRVDVQRMLKSSRHGPAAGAGGGGAAGAGAAAATKQPKRNNRKMWKGLYTRWFLLHKQAAQPLFAELRRGNFQLRRTLLSARAIRGGGQQRSHLLPLAVAPKRQRRNPSPPVPPFAQASTRAAMRSANSANSANSAAAAAGISSSSSSLADAAGSGPEPGAALPRTGSGGGGRLTRHASKKES